MKKYEYKVFKVKPKSVWSSKIEPEEIEKGLEELSKEGWELVSTTPITQTGTTMEIVFLLQRESRF